MQVIATLGRFSPLFPKLSCDYAFLEDPTNSTDLLLFICLLGLVLLFYFILFYLGGGL